MSKFKNHFDLYKKLKHDGENEVNSFPSRAELYFLSIFHLIEAVAALNNQHINKHQRVRKILEGYPKIFENQTEFIWREFQNIENRLRPKFSYGFSWTMDDFKELKDSFYKIEAICKERINHGNNS
jgi:hypothetical protein